MKRLLVLVLAVSLCLPVFSHAEEPSADVKSFMAEKAIKLTELTVECGLSDVYLAAMTGSSDITGTARAIAETLRGAPKAGTLYVLNEALFSAYLSASVVELSSLPEAVARKLRSAIPASLPSILSGNFGSSASLAAASILRSGEAYLAPSGCPDYALVVLRFGGDYDAACSFVLNENGIVSASLMPIPAGSADQLARLLTISGQTSGDLYTAYPLPVAGGANP